MKSTYNLRQIKQLIQENYFLVTQRALKEANLDFNFQEKDILSVVMTLTPADLDQTMPSHRIPGLWQDVYKKGVLLDGKVVGAYIKVQIIETPYQKVVVISFHKT